MKSGTLIPALLLFVFAASGMVNTSIAGDRARLALVIGNDAYTHVRPLSNAGNDARLIANTLRDAGFEVIGGVRTNLAREAMWSALDQLEGRIQKGDEVVFYFGGHGVQIGANPMLLPVDINAERDEQVLRNAISVTSVQDVTKNARLALLIIDACRDNPFPQRAGDTRGIGETRGLAPIEAAEGTAIFMSASRGQRALDMVPGVTANNGLFTYSLVQAIRAPGLDVRTALYRARDDVEERAKRVNHEQRPSLTDEMYGTFAFFPGAAATAHMSPGSTAEANVTPFGSLSITSKPAAGKVFLDGAYSGIAPLELSDVTAGVHAVRVELEGYVPFEEKVRVSAQQRLLLQSTLSPQGMPIRQADVSGSRTSPAPAGNRVPNADYSPAARPQPVMPTAQSATQQSIREDRTELQEKYDRCVQFLGQYNCTELKARLGAASAGASMAMPTAQSATQQSIREDRTEVQEKYDRCVQFLGQYNCTELKARLDASH